MLRIDSLIVENWCQFERREESFEGANMIGIVGPNGSGKSNFCEAMRFAFTGESGNHGNKDADLKYGADSGYVRVGFQINGVPCDLRRSITTASCRLKVGKDKPITKSKDVNAELQKLLGVDKAILHGYVFVRQDKIDSVLFEEPAKRKEALHKLFQMGAAEKIRGLLIKEMETIEVVSHKVRLDELAAEIPKRKADTEAAQGAFEKSKAHILPEEELKAARSLVHTYNLSLEAAGAISTLNTVLMDLLAKRDVKKAEVGAHNREVAAQESSLQTLVPNLAVSQQLVANASLIQAKQAESAQAQTNLGRVTAALQVMAIPQGDLPQMTTSLEGFNKSISTATHNIAQAEEYIRVFASGKCPTCDQPVADAQAQVQRRQQLLDDSRPLVAKAIEARDKLQGEINQYRTAKANYDLERSNLTTQAEGFRRTLEECAAMASAAVSQDELQKAQQLVMTHQNATTTLAASKAIGARIAEDHRELVNEVELKTGELNAKKEAAEQKIGDAEFKEAQTKVRAHDEYHGAYSEAKVAVKLALERDCQVLEERDRLLAEEEKGDKLRKFRLLMDNARAVLHKDNLPAIGARRFMKHIAANLGEFLEDFEAPFTVEIEEDLSLTCTFTDGTIQPANRLSGGEKMMLGACFRFAVNNLFAANLGLLELDEPTASLDDDRIDQAVRLMKRVREYTARSGMQVIVVTHEKLLMSAMDKVIRIAS